MWTYYQETFLIFFQPAHTYSSGKKVTTYNDLSDLEFLLTQNSLTPIRIP